ncbi:MAG: ABC transporter ATP-binding protein [Actinobacteria bacterium]|nr:ABC transporter ATP-binding protein [Actinomycetota bacterium]
MRDATVTIEPGERVLLLGASGAGKSTLLQGLGGVLGGADEGEAEGALLIDGTAAEHARGRVGMVLQDPDTQTILARVGDDVAFGCENLGVPSAEIWPRVDAALTAVGLDLPRERPTSALSGGQKQRLALAGVLAMRPGAILLDEPTANLDPAGVAEVRRAVGAALDATGATLVVIEHRIDAWIDLVDRAIVLGTEGDTTVVLADGDPRSVLAARGAELSAMGVWVPGVDMTARARELVRATERPASDAASADPGEAHLGAGAAPVAPGAAPVAPTDPGVTPGDSNSRAAGPTRLGEELLVAEGVVVARAKGVPVAGPFDLSLHAGEVLGITGPNGAGKSTLGLTLAGLIPTHAGRVRATPALNADAGGADPIRWSSRALLTRIGTVLQSPEHQLLAKTVRDELAVGPRALRLPDDEIDARVTALLRRLRLDALAAANPYTLSGGEKRRLTVAAALATRPRVLVLDEPTFGQDARTWAELVAIIAEVRDAGTAVIAISHDEDVLRALDARRLEVGT